MTPFQAWLESVLADYESVAEFARVLGVTSTAILYWRDRSFPNPDHEDALCRTTGIALTELQRLIAESHRLRWTQRKERLALRRSPEVARPALFRPPQAVAADGARRGTTPPAAGAPRPITAPSVKRKVRARKKRARRTGTAAAAGSRSSVNLAA